MFERVVGIDPGIAATGVAVVETMNGNPAIVTWADTVRTPPVLREPARLQVLHEALVRVIQDYRPQIIVLEQLMWGKNVGSAMGVARASGVVLLSAALFGLPVYEYAPLEVKMAITGSGNAPKDALRQALERMHRIRGVPTDPDAADAVAVAVCHLHRSRMEAALRRSAR